MYLLHGRCSSSSVHSGTPTNLNSVASRPATIRPHYCADSNNKLQRTRAAPVPNALGLLTNSSHARRTTVAVKAQQGPDKGSVAALEAALAAINNILGTYNKVRGPGKAGKQQGTASSRAAAAAGTPAGPSKLISFSAKASRSVPVKEVLKAALAQQDSSSSTNGASLHNSHAHGKHQQHHSSSSKGHKHQHSSSHKRKGSSSSSGSSDNSSWLQQLTGQHSRSNADSCDSSGQLLPAEALERSLQAYLALPLEQYSVLDPKLITRLPAGLDVEVFLEKLLAAQKARRAEKNAAQQQQGLETGLAAGKEDSSSSGGSSSGTSLDPVMKELPAPADASTAAAAAGGGGNNANSPGSNGASSSYSSDSTSSDGSSHAVAAVAQSDVLRADGAGAFLLRIPMKELLGVDLEPLLVIYVDIDPKHSQVTFRTNRLVIGDPRFDQEFKVDLIAKMSSKVLQAATLIPDTSPAAGDSSTSFNSSTSSSSSSSASTSSANGNGSTTGSTAAVSGTSVAVQQQEQAAAAAAGGPLQPVWQRNSSLSCKVKLSMTLRLPHPLSIVPGPLLSTTASLVAKLVMQALLPSFLELLATDYARWASGSSTAARQALPAGSLVAAGKQQLEQMKQQQQPAESEEKESVSSS